MIAKYVLKGKARSAIFATSYSDYHQLVDKNEHMFYSC